MQLRWDALGLLDLHLRLLWLLLRLLLLLHKRLAAESEHIHALGHVGHVLLPEHVWANVHGSLRVL